MPSNPTDDGSLIFFSLSSVSVSVSISDLEIVKRASERGLVLVLMYGWLVMETGERGRGDEGGSDTDLSRRFVEVREGGQGSSARQHSRLHDEEGIARRRECV